MNFEPIKNRNWKKWIVMGVVGFMGFTFIHEIISLSAFHLIFKEINHFISQEKTEQRDFEKSANQHIKTVESGMHQVLDGYNQGVGELNQKREKFFKKFDEGTSKINKHMDESWLEMRRSILVGNQIVMFSDDPREKAKIQTEIDEIDRVIAEYEKYSPTNKEEKELRHRLFVLQADLLANYNNDQYQILYTLKEKKDFRAKKEAIKKEIIITRERLKPYEKNTTDKSV